MIIRRFAGILSSLILISLASACSGELPGPLFVANIDTTEETEDDGTNFADNGAGDSDDDDGSDSKPDPKDKIKDKKVPLDQVEKCITEDGQVFYKVCRVSATDTDGVVHEVDELTKRKNNPWDYMVKCKSAARHDDLCVFIQPE